MKRLLATAATVLAAAVIPVGSANAAFGLTDFQVEITNEDGTPAILAGSHPHAITTSFGIAFSGEGNSAIVEGKVRDAIFEQVVGLVGDATAVPRCSAADFLVDRPGGAACPLESVVGVQGASVNINDFFKEPGPVFNLEPPPGAAVRLGWKVEHVPIVVDVSVKNEPDHNAVAATLGVNQTVAVFRSIVELWGVPADPTNDLVRGWECMGNAEVEVGRRIKRVPEVPPCESDAPELPFLTLPRSCEGPAVTRFQVRSWQEPDVWLTGSHAGPGFERCDELDFAPGIGVRATTGAAETGTGLDFSIDFEDLGLTDPKGRAQSDLEKAIVTLPEGVTINPSVGEGLGACTPDDLSRETLHAAPGTGCPSASKIGTVAVETPLLDDVVKGSVFLAQQDDPGTPEPGEENPFDSLIAFYIVLKDPKSGILVKQPAKVEPDARTGQLVTTVDDVPQLPFSHFTFHLREGQRAPLVTPPTCGTHTTLARLIPRTNPGKARTVSSSFEIGSGVGGGACPSGGVLPFNPRFEAGTRGNGAGTFAPFQMRLRRNDGEQDITKLSAVLPPGLVAKLAGVGRCSNAQIGEAKGKSGRQEQSSPSCPAHSQIGRTVAGAGVGSALTYVPGDVYLAGPYKGAPLSVVSITPALAGPFDAGTVVVRIALTLNPLTAQVEANGAASDPIPHILKGIPLKLRDLRIYLDRSNFTLNPTSCNRFQVNATLFGSFLDLLSPADDVYVDRKSPFQAASCRDLGFKPSLKLRLKGGTRRGAHPALRAVLKARPGDANIGAAKVTLPRSAFLEQAHIRTICTRVQYAADQCPPGSVYGWARAFTPLLDQPLEGPVYLRSSDNDLPDLVVALKGIVELDLSSRIDSHKGGIRSTFQMIPDAPVSKFVLTMRGGRKGLIVNSRDLCTGKSRASTRFVAQNSKVRTPRALVRAKCGKKHNGGKRR